MRQNYIAVLAELKRLDKHIVVDRWASKRLMANKVYIFMCVYIHVCIYVLYILLFIPFILHSPTYPRNPYPHPQTTLPGAVNTFQDDKNDLEGGGATVWLTQKRSDHPLAVYYIACHRMEHEQFDRAMALLQRVQNKTKGCVVVANVGLHYNDRSEAFKVFLFFERLCVFASIYLIRGLYRACMHTDQRLRVGHLVCLSPPTP